MTALDCQVQEPLCLTVKKSPKVIFLTGHIGTKTTYFRSNSADSQILFSFASLTLTKIHIVAVAVRNAG